MIVVYTNRKPLPPIETSISDIDFRLFHRRVPWGIWEPKWVVYSDPFLDGCYGNRPERGPLVHWTLEAQLRSELREDNLKLYGNAEGFHTVSFSTTMPDIRAFTKSTYSASSFSLSWHGKFD